MKKLAPLTLAALALTLTACGGTTENTNATNAPTATATATATQSPTATTTPEATHSAEAAKPTAEGNDYATGMTGVVKSDPTPGSVTVVTGDQPVVTPNPEHTATKATNDDKSKLENQLKTLDGSPVISGNSVVIPKRTYDIQPAESREANGVLDQSKYAEIVIIDDVQPGNPEYAIVSAQIKGNEADIKANGPRPISSNSARQALNNNDSTRIQGFSKYEPNAVYTGKDILVLHIKQANHGAYAKGGATPVPTPAPSN